MLNWSSNAGGVTRLVGEEVKLWGPFRSIIGRVPVQTVSYFCVLICRPFRRLTCSPGTCKSVSREVSSSMNGWTSCLPLGDVGALPVLCSESDLPILTRIYWTCTVTHKTALSRLSLYAGVLVRGTQVKIGNSCDCCDCLWRWAVWGRVTWLTDPRKRKGVAQAAYTLAR